MVAYTFSLNFADAKKKYQFEKYPYLPKDCFGGQFCPYGVAPEGMIHRLRKDWPPKQSCCKSSDPKNNMMLKKAPIGHHSKSYNLFKIVPYKEGQAVGPLPRFPTITNG